MLVGLSRLPLNSVERAASVFLGRAGFFSSLKENSRPANEPLELLDFDPGRGSEVLPEHVRRFELFLRNADTRTLEAGADHIAKLGNADAGILLRKVFNETSLTPYTQFTDNALDFAGLLFKRSALSFNRYAAFLLGLVRQTVFHLTAYDLITFHHQGANYPDALLLDALMRKVLDLAGTHPETFGTTAGNDRSAVTAMRRRRRAFLLGWWMHRFLEGLAVPDAPTSPGENRRLMPAPHRAVPEEQLNQPGRRSRRLFAERPIDWRAHRNLLIAGLEELADPDMLLDLGTGLFLDRPFGLNKPPAALDLTPLLSYSLFSRKLAIGRLEQITQLEPWLESTPAWVAARNSQPDSREVGVAVPMPRTSARTVKLQDCWRTSDDFVVRGATIQTVRQLKAFFDWRSCPTPLRDWHEQRLVPVPMPGDSSAICRIVFFDADWKVQAECTVADELGFRRRGALELPSPGLAIVHGGVRHLIAARFPLLRRRFQAAAVVSSGRLWLHSRVTRASAKAQKIRKDRFLSVASRLCGWRAGWRSHRQCSQMQSACLIWSAVIRATSCTTSERMSSKRPSRVRMVQSRLKIGWTMCRKLAGRKMAMTCRTKSAACSLDRWPFLPRTRSTGWDERPLFSSISTS